MMVIHPILYKMAFIDTGRNYGHPVDVQRCNRLIAVGIGLLKAYLKRCSVGTLPDAEHIAAQIDDGALHAFLHEIVLHAVRDIALGDGP